MLLGDVHANADVATAISTKGTLSERPAPGTAGRFYEATDVKALYRDTGAAWELTAVAPGSGAFSSRPTSPFVAGREFLPTDRAGVLYRDNGAAWDGILLSLAPGTLSARPSPAVAGRVYPATDVKVAYLDTGGEWLALPYSLASGLLSARPGSPFVAGREYVATDVEGLLYRDNGSGWDSILLNGGRSGALSARPAAGHVGLHYRATDNGVTYLDTGSEWVAITPEPGVLRLSAQETMPGGWLKCEGQLVNRVTYAALFAAIGTRYGPGDGVNTFQLPDYRERVPMGPGGTNAAGTKPGAATMKLQGVHVPSAVAQVWPFFDGAALNGSPGWADPFPGQNSWTIDGSIRFVGPGGSKNWQGFVNQLGVTSEGFDAATGVKQNAYPGNTAFSLVQPSTVCEVWIKT